MSYCSVASSSPPEFSEEITCDEAPGDGPRSARGPTEDRWVEVVDSSGSEKD